MIEHYAKPQGRLPAALTAELELEGYTHPVWIAYPLKDGQREEIERALALLERRLTPAVLAVIDELVAEMIAHFGKTETVETAMFSKHLQEFSAEHVASGVAELMRREQIPTAKMVREAVFTRWCAAKLMEYRARTLLGLREPSWCEKPEWAEPKVRKERYVPSFAETRRAASR